jgi:hypothetical protein
MGAVLVVLALAGRAGADPTVDRATASGGAREAIDARAPLVLGAGPRPALARLALLQEPAPYVPPGANPAPPAVERRPLTRQWWFWAAIGGAAVTTLAVILIATSGGSSPPGSTLGDMEVFGGR